jgi:hypothetical protein
LWRFLTIGRKTIRKTTVVFKLIIGVGGLPLPKVLKNMI